MLNIKNDQKYLDELYLNPDYLYIPYNNDQELSVRSVDIKMGSSILKNDIEKTFSPISGKIIGKTSNYAINNKIVNALVIENDFTETKRTNKGVVKDFSRYTNEEILNILKTYKIGDFDFSKKTLVVSAIDKDPFEKTLSFVMQKKMIEILDTIDLIANKFEIENVLIVTHNQDADNVLNLTNNLGSYPNIKLKLVSNLYPLGFSLVLLNHLKLNDALFMNVEDILNIYNALRLKKGITEKYITLGGNAIKEPKIIYVKIGTSVEDLIKNNAEITKDKYYVIKNGLVGGITLKSLKEIIDPTTRSIMLNTSDESSETKCINCGLCTRKCPVGIDPKYLMNHKSDNIKKCIHCGLCSYICPAKINFKNYLTRGEDDE